MSGPFKMKYKNSAFPFKSPLKQGGMEFDVTGDGVTPVDVETRREAVKRGHSPRGSVADILKKREENKESPIPQAIGGGAGEALEHWKQFKKKAKEVGEKVVKTGKKVAKTAGRGNILALLLGSTTTAKATQPGTGGHGGTKVQQLKDIDN